MIKVRATRTGYYNHQRIKEDKDGNFPEFEIKNMKEFSESWMEKVNVKYVEVKKQKNTSSQERKPIAMSAGANAILHQGTVDLPDAVKTPVKESSDQGKTTTGDEVVI